MFKRKIYENLRQWKAQSQGKTALLIEGARRVGKSTIAQIFGRNEYKTHVLIDFSIAGSEIIGLFDNLMDLDYFFLRLQLLTGVQLHQRESLIIFDEIQFCPKARQAIKHLVKDGRYDYIETGSLISIRKNVKDILIPSEETCITIFPMDYEEFCWAIDDHVTVDTLRTFYEAKKPLGDDLNRVMLRKYRLYMLIGGMPQAVSTYCEANNFAAVDRVKRDILTLYRNDFYKIDATGKITRLFQALPAQLEKDVSRYQVSSVLSSERASSVEEFLAQMESSKTVVMAYQVSDPNIGLSAHVDADMFKMYLGDTGLFVTLAFSDRDFSENLLYQKLLADKLSVNLGYLFENVVAQTLVTNGYRLFYHVFRSPSGNTRYEVDFLLPGSKKLRAVEVKSSNYRRHVSLDKFADKYSARVGERIVIYTKDFRRESGVTYLPVYMTQFL